LDAVVILDPGRSLRFGAAQRHRTAVHEAGHAVAYSLAGFGLECVEIADEGLPLHELDRLGFCESCGAGVFIVGLHWSRDWGGFVIDRRAHLAHVRHLQRPHVRHLRRHMRASACARLAGHLAEQRVLERATFASLESIAAGRHAPQDLFAMLQAQEFEIDEAQAICSLLPSRRAYEHALRATACALLDHWPFVEQLASTLERMGRVQGQTLARLLPPAKRHWPPAQVK
jgi:hypothetical protein